MSKLLKEANQMLKFWCLDADNSLEERAKKKLAEGGRIQVIAPNGDRCSVVRAGENMVQSWSEKRHQWESFPLSKCKILSVDAEPKENKDNDATENGAIEEFGQNKETEVMPLEKHPVLAQDESKREELERRIKDLEKEDYIDTFVMGDKPDPKTRKLIQQLKEELKKMPTQDEKIYQNGEHIKIKWGSREGDLIDVKVLKDLGDKVTVKAPNGNVVDVPKIYIKDTLDECMEVLKLSGFATDAKVEVGDRVLVDAPRIGKFIGRVTSLASRWADIKILMDEGLKGGAREGDVVSIEYNYIREKA